MKANVNNFYSNFNLHNQIFNDLLGTAIIKFSGSGQHDRGRGNEKDGILYERPLILS